MAPHYKQVPPTLSCLGQSPCQNAPNYLHAFTWATARGECTAELTAPCKLLPRPLRWVPHPLSPLLPSPQLLPTVRLLMASPNFIGDWKALKMIFFLICHLTLFEILNSLFFAHFFRHRDPSPVGNSRDVHCQECCCKQTSLFFCFWNWLYRQ